MGTRNLSMAKIDGELKVAQYGQWDGYPSGAGVDILNFIQKTDMNSFKEKVRNCTFVSEEYVNNLWKSLGAKGNGMVTMEISERFSENYPEFHRDTGSKIFELINESDNGIGLLDNRKFGDDSLFCEWAYLIDFDNECLTVYANGVYENSIVERFSFESLKTISKDEFVYLLENEKD